MIKDPMTIKAELAKIGKTKGLKMPEMQLLLAQERFLARLLSLPEGKNYVWKGGSLVIRRYNQLAKPRFTIDVDLLVQGAKVDDTQEDFNRALSVDLGDGFGFKNIQKEDFQRDTPYGGVSYLMEWTFFKKPSSRCLKIDVCTGDIVEALEVGTKEVFLLAGSESITAKIYPPEYIFAEKLETSIRFGKGNTRLKDFIDLWNLSQNDMNQQKLAVAIRQCFERRGQVLDKQKILMLYGEKDFIDFLNYRYAKAAEFKRLDTPPLEEIFHQIRAFLEALPIP